ncbi:MULTISPECIES: DUF6898 family protein [unclassified Hwanghaeella]|jgi:uncharacterized protein DUF6898|uniref:DUF6898 family protein n=1 Tax=unclassified Hwanghaeella TaxID=2605944 RepID=UPI003B674FEB|tara:strand:- start:236 stop:532 length:297 start_codon:yes stop_codon:yes gene_type:complete
MSRKMMPGNSTVLPQGALIEFVPQGRYVKVCAVDPVTYIEVSIVGDITAGEHILSVQALRKLERMVYKSKFDKNVREKDQDRVILRARRAETPSGWDL